MNNPIEITKSIKSADLGTYEYYPLSHFRDRDILFRKDATDCGCYAYTKFGQGVLTLSGYNTPLSADSRDLFTCVGVIHKFRNSIAVIAE